MRRNLAHFAMNWKRLQQERDKEGNGLPELPHNWDMIIIDYFTLGAVVYGGTLELGVTP